VLLDEVEKAHKDVFNILLQVLDDGRITDSHGRMVDFRNAIIVMTSNIGSEHILKVKGEDRDYDKIHNQVTQALRKHFRPEFLNRIDDLIVFHGLKKEELKEIVGIQIKGIQRLLKEQKIAIELTPAAQDRIVDIGYDPAYGARPVKRAIRRELQNPIATKLLENVFVEEDTILVDCIDQELIFTKKQPLKTDQVLEQPNSGSPLPLATEINTATPDKDATNPQENNDQELGDQSEQAVTDEVVETSKPIEVEATVKVEAEATENKVEQDPEQLPNSEQEEAESQAIIEEEQEENPDTLNKEEDGEESSIDEDDEAAVNSQA